jgi:hypothetical protein
MNSMICSGRKPTGTAGYTRVDVDDLRQVVSRCHPRERRGAE